MTHMITHKLIEILTTIASITTITLVIMNQPQSGDNFGSSASVTQTRRGFEKQLHTMTVVSAVIMFVLVLASQVIK